MNQQDNHTVQKDGKYYRYDSDYDCFYRVYTRDEYNEFPHWDKYSWIYVVLFLSAIAYYVEYVR